MINHKEIRVLIAEDDFLVQDTALCRPLYDLQGIRLQPEHSFHVVSHGATPEADGRKRATQAAAM